ncbi:MAG: LytTR family DNA-binding domain-containing protein [Bacteroidia bacterium]|nr:LytTR family DNA-binding domain-containing protein [Bacteroidia bacterium]
MIKTLIVDDEPLALDILETYIDKLPDLELVAKCDNAIDANEMIQSADIDLVFLDIQMPQMTGIELVKSLSNPPKIVFTTAYEEYAIDGFELNAVDYLMKPIAFDRFLKAVNKAKESMAPKSNNAQSEDFFFVKADKKLVKIHFNEILYIEGLKDYVIIKKEAGRVIALQTMKSLETKLPDQIFMRVHRSYIVNIQKIKAVIGNAIEIIESGQPKHIPIGKNYKEDLIAIIETNKL